MTALRLMLATIVTAWILIPAALLIGHAYDAVIADGAAITCQEDMPCWNCATMGNHICGNEVNYAP